MLDMLNVIVVFKDKPVGKRKEIFDQMSKNLEDLKKDGKDIGYYDDLGVGISIIYYLVPVLEDFEKRLSKLEKREEGLGPKIRLIESPELIKSGRGIKPKTKRPRPKPRPKVIYNYKIGGTDPD